MGACAGKAAAPSNEEAAHAPTEEQARAVAAVARSHAALVAAADALKPEERPKERCDEDWREESGSDWVHFGGESLEPLLEHTTLVDARYLVALAEAGGIVPRWQDLPECAKITPANVWRLRVCADGHMLPVCVLSYPWLDKASAPGSRHGAGSVGGARAGRGLGEGGARAQGEGGAPAVRRR